MNESLLIAAIIGHPAVIRWRGIDVQVRRPTVADVLSLPSIMDLPHAQLVVAMFKRHLVWPLGYPEPKDIDPEGPDGSLMVAVATCALELYEEAERPTRPLGS